MNEVNQKNDKTEKFVSITIITSTSIWCDLLRSDSLTLVVLSGLIIELNGFEISKKYLCL